MKIEDPELVIVRLCLLVLIVIFGISGNILAIILNARSFQLSRLNSIAYLHLACLDLLLCLFHAPIGIGLESCGYFSLYNDVPDRYGALFFLNKQISLRAFFISSFASYVTLGAIAFLRCWVIFNPFKRPRHIFFITLLLAADLVTIVIVCLTPIPSFYFDSSSGLNYTLNGTSLDTESSLWTDKNETVTMQDFASPSELFRDGLNESLVEGPATGRTVTGDHGVTVVLLVYTLGATLVMVTFCYVLICYKLQKSFSQLAADFKKSGTDNTAMRAFLKRQVNHVKTHVILIATLMITVMPTIIIAVGNFEVSYALIRLRSTIVAVSSAINPFVYCLLKSSNRGPIFNMLTCNRRKSEHPALGMTISQTVSQSTI